MHISGDIPALSKLLLLKGHNGISPCVHCTIQSQIGTNNHRYPALLQVENGTDCFEDYDPGKLPLRSSENINEIYEDLRFNQTKKAKLAKIQQESGIKGKAAIVELLPASIPDSLGIDIMHLLFTNYFKLLLQVIQYDMNNEERKKFVKLFNETQNHIPSIFGRKLSYLTFDSKTQIIASLFSKAEEWKSFGLIYLLPSLYASGYRDRVTIFELSKFISSIQAITQTKDPVTRILYLNVKQNIQEWMVFFEEKFYRRKRKKLHVCTYNSHLLLHLVDTIFKLGPAWCTAQYTCESFIGRRVSKDGHNKHTLLLTIANNIHLKQQIFNLLCTVEGYSQTSISDKILKNPIGLIGNEVELKNDDSKFIKALTTYFNVIYFEEDPQSMDDILEEVKKAFVNGVWLRKYSKLNTETGHQTGSEYLTSLKEARSDSRDNSLVYAPQLMDKNMNLKQRRVEFVWVNRYFNVKYYFTCLFRNHSYSLALCVNRKPIHYQYQGDMVDYGLQAVETKKKDIFEIWKVINAATIKRNVSESHSKSIVWIGDREAIYNPIDKKEKSIMLERKSGSDKKKSSDEDYF